MAMLVANPQTGQVIPSTPPRVLAAWAALEQMRDAVAARAIAPDTPERVRLPAIAALRRAALSHSLPSALAVRVVERRAREAAAAGALALRRPGQAAAPAMVGQCLRPSAGSSLATQRAEAALRRSAGRREECASTEEALAADHEDAWPEPLPGVADQDVFSAAAVPGGHATLDTAGAGTTGAEAVAVLAVLLQRNPSAEAAAAGSDPPQSPFTAATYSALLSALADVAACRPALSRDAVEGIVGFCAAPPKDLVPRDSTSVADLDKAVAASLRTSVLRVLAGAGAALRQDHKTVLQAALSALGASGEGEAAAHAGAMLPLWSVIAAEAPLWEIGAAAPSGTLAGWPGTDAPPPPPSPDEAEAMASARRGAAPGPSPSARESPDEGLSDDDRARAKHLRALDAAAGPVLSDAALYEQMRVIDPAARRRVALAALAALPYPDRADDGTGKRGAAFLASRAGGAALVEWAAEAGGFAAAGAVRILAGGVTDGVAADDAGAAAAPADAGEADVLGDALADAFGGGRGAGRVGQSSAGQILEEEQERRGGADGDGDDTDATVLSSSDAAAALAGGGGGAAEAEAMGVKAAWVLANRAFGRVARMRPSALASSGRAAVRAAARVTSLLASDPSLSWAAGGGGVQLASDDVDASNPCLPASMGGEGGEGEGTARSAEERTKFLSAVASARRAREELAVSMAAKDWGSDWRAATGVLWRAWARERVGEAGLVAAGRDAARAGAYHGLSTSLLRRVLGLAAETAAGADAHGKDAAAVAASPAGTLRGVLFSLPSPPAGFAACVCEAVESTALDAAEALAAMTDLAKARPGARAEAASAVLRLCVAWSGETRRRAIAAAAISLLPLVPDQVVDFASRACWTLATSEEDAAAAAAAKAVEDEAEAQSAAEGRPRPARVSPADEAIKDLEASTPVSKGDAVRRCHLLVGLSTRRPELVADVLAPVYAAAPRQRKVMDEQAEPLVGFLTQRDGVSGPVAAASGASAAADGQGDEDGADAVWERRALVRSFLRAVVRTELEAERKAAASNARKVGQLAQAELEAAVAVLRMPSADVAGIARTLFVRGSLAGGAMVESVLSIGADWGAAREPEASSSSSSSSSSVKQEGAAEGGSKAPAAQETSAEGAQAGTAVGSLADSAGYGEAGAAQGDGEEGEEGEAEAELDPGACREGPGLRGDVSVLVPVARALEPSEVIFVCGRLVASEEPTANRTLISLVHTLFSAREAPVPFHKKDDRPGAGPGAYFSRPQFLHAVLVGGLGAQALPPHRHRAAVDACVRDAESFPDDVLRIALSAVLKAEAPPLVAFRAMALAAQARGDAGRRLVASLLDEVRAAAPWDKAGDDMPSAKRSKQEGGATPPPADDGAVYWRSFLRVASACVGLALPVLARLPSSRVRQLVRDEAQAGLADRLREWAGDARMRRSYGVTREVLGELGIKDAPDAPSEASKVAARPVMLAPTIVVQGPLRPAMAPGMAAGPMQALMMRQRMLGGPHAAAQGSAMQALMMRQQQAMMAAHASMAGRGMPGPAGMPARPMMMMGRPGPPGTFGVHPGQAGPHAAPGGGGAGRVASLAEAPSRAQAPKRPRQ